MVQSQFSLSWDSYKSSICKGFSSLQQNGEFVDMTLAADGHYVKVHQVLIALASPYLKELISSAPCQHPVLFLNNISNRTLSLLLMYIYTGEVMVPSDHLASFAEAAKALHIKGLENLTGYEGMTLKVAENMSQIEEGELCHVSGIKRMDIPMNEGTKKIGLPAAARKIIVKKESQLLQSSDMQRTQTFPSQGATSMPEANKPDYIEIDTMDDTVTHDSDDDFKTDESFAQQVRKSEPVSDTPVTNLQFTVSIRGSLQIILNRYLYNLHSSKQAAGVRRWRCVDYRNHKCMAFVVTKGNVVLNRANLHNHPFHDKKILSKIEKKSVYSALDEVFGYKEKEELKMTDNDASMEQDDFAILEDFGTGMNEISNKSTEFMKDKIN
ncbi:hypothetical protein ABMA27_002118 [Loxostege sticticalis]|uniref:BTB domain-containing protein n=1 Tax=Loxostege sticticalis TaxID=481309 RepID=A0ABR3HWM2_LOXSC